MPRCDAERLADGLLRGLRPFLVDLIGVAMTPQEPASEEDRYVAERVAKQLERLRAPNNKAATRRRNAKP